MLKYEGWRRGERILGWRKEREKKGKGERDKERKRKSAWQWGTREKEGEVSWNKTAYEELEI